MKKALVVFAILFAISLFTTIVSLVVCGGELVRAGIEYGKEVYEEQNTQNQNDVMAMIEMPIAD